MKLNLTKFNQKIIENCFFQRVPKVVFLVPSKVEGFYKRKQVRKKDLTFYKEVKETKALFREEGFSERIINSVPELIKTFNRSKPVLDRLAKC